MFWFWKKKSDQPAAPSIPSNGYKILIAEDEPVLRDSLITTFKNAGFEVSAAADGEQAIQLATSFKPNIVLLDIYMPKYDGLAVLTQYKQDPNLQTVPVLMLTNDASSSKMLAAQQQGSAGYLIKSNTELSEVLARVKSTLNI